MIKLESSPNPSLNGEPVTFSTRVSVPRGSTPSGTVSITDGKETIYSVHTDGDVASVATNVLSIGEHSIQARFVADTSELYVGDKGNLVQVVNDPKDRERRTVLSLTEQLPVVRAQ
jgi:allophanate hydrolase subunit 1